MNEWAILVSKQKRESDMGVRLEGRNEPFGTWAALKKKYNDDQAQRGGGGGGGEPLGRWGALKKKYNDDPAQRGGGGGGGDRKSGVVGTECRSRWSPYH